MPLSLSGGRASAAKADPERHSFRRVGKADLPMIVSWLNAEHVRRWWPEPADRLAEVEEILENPAVDPYVVGFDARPIGYVQVYDAHAEEAHPYRDQPAGTHGIDQFIGEADMIGRGHGPRFVGDVCALLFDAGAPRVVTDPDPSNVRAVRAYEKAGFVALDERVTVDGPVVLMARDRA
jgi:aminoglycoside 6'-N-acetyltransferase